MPDLPIIGMLIQGAMGGGGSSALPAAQGQPGASGQPGTVVTSAQIRGSGESASVTMTGDAAINGVDVSVNGNEPVQLIVTHPPLGFISAEVDLDVTPVAALQPGQPLTSDRVWIELAGVAFDRAVFVPQPIAATDPMAPVVGSLVLYQGTASVYTFNDLHAGHYAVPGGGVFSVGVDPATGYHYVAYGPAAAA